jgi:predicted aspartyl protease
VVESTFTIHGCSVTALIDFGSTHSFVNEISACHLNWIREELSYEIHVSTPLGKSAVANQFVPNCEIQVEREVIKEDLIVIPIEDYDLILGMDWLSKHGARVNCRNKVVQCVRPEPDMVEIKGN